MHSPRHLAALLLLVLALTAAVTEAFVPSIPMSSSLINSRRIISNGKPPSAPTTPPTTTTTVARLSPFDVADALVAAAAETDYEYGAVAAPGALSS